MTFSSVLKLALRGKRGDVVAFKLKEKSKLNNTLIIMLIALTQEANIKRSYGVDLVDYLTKAFNIETLFLKIEKYLNRR